jgi:8-oxo-dGTP pyrophosphatase MutT (NUDIX family)
MLRQATVMVIQNSAGQVLLLERSSDHKHFPDEWCLPGGKRELPSTWAHPLMQEKVVKESDYIETPEVTNYRETFEETGIKAYVFHKLGDITLMDDKFHCIVFVAIGYDYDVPSSFVFPNREHKQYRWFSKDELPIKLGKMTRILLEDLMS